MHKNIEKISIEYLKETLVYLWIQNDNIKKFQDSSLKKISDSINTNTNFINDFSNLIQHNTDVEIYNLYSDTSIRWMVIMLLSTFEYYLWTLCEIHQLPNWQIHSNLKKLENQLNIKFEDSLGNDLYLWLSEITLRRNLYVHNNWVIDQKYIDDISKFNITNIPSYNEKLVVWYKLKPISTIYVKTVLINLVSIILLISTLSLKKNNKLSDEYLSRIWKIFLTSTHKEHLIYSFYKIVRKHVNFEKFNYFSLIVVSDLYNELIFYKQHKSEYIIWPDIYNIYLKLILNWLSSPEELTFYHALRKNNFKFSEIIKQEIINGNDEIFVEILWNNITWKMFLKEFKESFGDIFKLRKDKIHAQKIINRILQEQQKWFLQINNL